MSVRITRPPTVRFVQIRNEWARDRRISMKAVGLLTYLHSHADGYELSLSQMVRDHTDGKDSVRTGLDELEACGYLRRLRERDGGRFGETDYELSDPFDASGRLLPPERWEIRQDPAEDEREIRQSGKSARADSPQREIRPIEEQGENTTESPTGSPTVSGQLRLVEHPPPGLSAAATFDAFWAAYPRKVGKDAARRAWTKAARRADPAVLLAAVRAYPFDTSRPEFIPHPTTWLNAGRWEDDPAAVRPAGNRGSTVTGANYGPGYRNPDPKLHPDAFSGTF